MKSEQVFFPITLETGCWNYIGVGQKPRDRSFSIIFVNSNISHIV
jgi:hypothetical protein